MIGSTAYNTTITGRITALLLLLLSYCSVAGAQDYRVKEYGVNDGLPQDYVYSIHQDALGYLWIGTGEGLARFDGMNFEVFTVNDSLCSNFISCSLNTGLDSWFGHNDGGISYFDGKAFSKVVTAEENAGRITDIGATGEQILASTQSGGIWSIGPDHIPVLLEDPEQEVQIFTMEILSSTELAVGSLEGVLLYSIDPASNSLTFRSSISGIPETKIQYLLLSQDQSTLYILTEDEGIYSFDPYNSEFAPLPLGIDMEAGIEGAQQMLEDSQGNLWISTFGNGLYKLITDGQGKFTSWINYSELNGLPGDNLKIVFEDREKNLWLGMFGEGLARLVDEAFTFYSFNVEDTGNNIHSIYVTPETVYFGTDNGLITYNRTSREHRLLSSRVSGLPEDIITAMAGSPGGDLWVGTDKNGVYHLHPGEQRLYRVPISASALENSVNALVYEDSLLWIATDRGVCRLHVGTGEPGWYTISNAGLPHNTVDNLQLDASGKIWISTFSNVLAYFEHDSLIRYDIPTIEAALNIRSVNRDPDGELWIGTYGSGVYKLEEDSAIHYGREDGLLSDFCSALESDDLNFIWVSHRGGLSRIRVSDGLVSQVKEEAGIAQSMEFNQNAVFKDPSGSIWFGSTSGVLAYDPGLEIHHTLPPALSIVSVVIDNTGHPVEDEIKLPPGRHTISIEFVGINLENPQGVTYSYKMDGLDEQWSRPNPVRLVTYTQLPYGEYTFSLRAYDSYGNSSLNPLELHIHISKPLWKIWWIQFLVLIAIGSIILGIIKRRERALRMEKEKLEKIVKERTKEVVKQKEEIEQQRDAIQIQSERINLINQNITDSIIYASHIQKALFPPPESLAAIFPESFILSRPQYIVSGDFFWMAHQKGKHIFTVADCTGHGVPGALMSMLGITLLDKIVNTQKNVDPARILNQLKDGIISALRQTIDRETTSDGMDMALCVYDPDSHLLQYSGGFMPMVLVRDGELTRHKADPMPVGIGAIVGRKFITMELEIQKGDQLYLYSDGYEDQFGGEENVKFSRKSLRELLLEIHTLPAQDQKARLEQTMNEWMKGYDQIDDMMILGIRF